MGRARGNQNLQDRITQQWVIWTGKKIYQEQHNWLLGPFGKTGGIGAKYIDQLAREENLQRNTSAQSKGLIASIGQLNLSKKESEKLSEQVRDFYEKTSDYALELQVRWNPFFKAFGYLVGWMFSKRIQQLNIPLKNPGNASGLTSDIIQLQEAKTGKVRRTIWLRTFRATGQIVYSGIYGVETLPSGKACIKAIFPLPNGNATVLLEPRVGPKGELRLESAGNTFGDAGFYFLLKDSRGQLWARFVRSFKDSLIVQSQGEVISAVQTLKLWGLQVVRFEYRIFKKTEID